VHEEDESLHRHLARNGPKKKEREGVDKWVEEEPKEKDHGNNLPDFKKHQYKENQTWNQNQKAPRGRPEGP